VFLKLSRRLVFKEFLFSGLPAGGFHNFVNMIFQSIILYFMNWSSSAMNHSTDGWNHGSFGFSGIPILRRAARHMALTLRAHRLDGCGSEGVAEWQLAMYMGGWHGPIRPPPLSDS
jgi:hypothetical protein